MMYDYSIIASCQYEVEDGGDCGEPATHSVWWDKDGRDIMKVCKEHFEYIKKCEAEDAERIARDRY